MPIRVYCPHPGCGQRYKVAAEQLGKIAVCKRCGRPFPLRGPSGDAVDPPPGVGAGTIVWSPGESPAPAPVPPVAAAAPQKLGRFLIRDRIGAGIFGVVYRAYDPILQRDVALKVPQAAALQNAKSRARFLREPKASAQLRHPHIVPVYDAGSDGPHDYIASAYIEGETLARRIARQPLSFRQSAELVQHLAEALHYAHRQGIVHRDVKPANVMLDQHEQPLLMDFGLARIDSEEGKLTQEGTLLGTPAYMAPEVIDRALGPISPASDQYSLGIILYELLCGEVPFRGTLGAAVQNILHGKIELPRKRRPGIPRDLETISMKALARRPGDRYADCAALALDLRRWLADEPIRARRMGLVERAGRWTRRNPVLATLCAMVVALAVVSSLRASQLYASSRALREAVSQEQARRRAVQAATEKAERQTRLAEKARAAAKEKERFAETALTRLRAEMEARNQAEAQKQEEARRRDRLAADVRTRETQMSADTSALDAAEQKAQQAAAERTQAEQTARRALWETPAKGVAAVEAALTENRSNDAQAILEACPEAAREWEWQYLTALCAGNQPAEKQLGVGKSQQLAVSANGRYLVALDENAGEGALAAGVYELPSGKRIADVPRGAVSYALPSPDGQSLVVRYFQTGGGSWEVVDLASGKATVLAGNDAPQSPPLFIPDSEFLVYRTRPNELTIYSSKLRRVVKKLDGTGSLSVGVRDGTHGGPSGLFRTYARDSRMGAPAGAPWGDLACAWCRLVLTDAGDWWSPRGAERLGPDALEWYRQVAQFPGNPDSWIYSADRERLLMCRGGVGRVLAKTQVDPHSTARLPEKQWQVLSPKWDRLLSMSPDGKRVARLGADNRIRLWDVERGTEAPALGALGWCQQTLAPPVGEVVGAVFAADWSRVALLTTVAEGRRVYVWSAPPPAPAPPPAAKQPALAKQPTPMPTENSYTDGLTLVKRMGQVTWSNESWRPRYMGQYLGQYLERRRSHSIDTEPHGMAFHPDGRLFGTTASTELPGLELVLLGFWRTKSNTSNTWTAIKPRVDQRVKTDPQAADEPARDAALRAGMLWFSQGPLAFDRSGTCYLAAGASERNGIVRMTAAVPPQLERLPNTKGAHWLQVPPCDDQHLYLTNGETLYRYPLSSPPAALEECRWFSVSGQAQLTTFCLVRPGELLITMRFDKGVLQTFFFHQETHRCWALHSPAYTALALSWDGQCLVHSARKTDRLDKVDVR